jgi:hypothetical protein
LIRSQMYSLCAAHKLCLPAVGRVHFEPVPPAEPAVEMVHFESAVRYLRTVLRWGPSSSEILRILHPFRANSLIVSIILTFRVLLIFSAFMLSV